MKKIVSLLLVVAMILCCVPVTGFASEVARVADYGEPLSLTATAGTNQTNGVSTDLSEAHKGELTKFESLMTPFSKNEAAETYDEDDVVTFIVVADKQPLLSLYSVQDIAAQTASVKKHLDEQNLSLNAIKSNVQRTLGMSAEFKMGYTYTIATTGFSVTTTYGNRAVLEAMPGVKQVYLAPVFSLPETAADEALYPYTSNSSGMIGAGVLNASGYTGKGMRIAILDTGLKVDHPSFAALPESALEDPMTRESVSAIWDDLNASQMTNMLNLSYYSTKVPFMFNYSEGSFNVSNLYAGSDHGTHVAGIAAANKLSSTEVVGVAPDAQLVVMQVFQSNGGAGWETIMAALEDCVRLEVDVANMSLGSAAGFTDPAGAMLETLELFLDSDIQLIIAAGNDANSAYMNAWGYNMPLITDPDIGLAGTPSTYSAALSVASVDNNGQAQLYFTVGGKDIGYMDTAYESDTVFLTQFRNETLEYVVVPGYGEPSDYEGLDVAGKVALVTRGNTSFPEKQQAAQDAGAIAIVVYNNAKGLFGMQINDGNGAIPAVSVTMESGLYMIEQAEQGNNSLTVCDGDTKLFRTDVMVSDFSSWGVTPDLKLKPEIAGFGGNIYSTVDSAISGSNYAYMSGTSMASPQVAGAMAILVQYLEKNFPDISGAEQRRMAANLMMSTATPAMVSNTLEYTPRMQGAGVVDLVKATTAAAYLSVPASSEGRPKAELGDDPTRSGVFAFTFEITNISGEAVTYTFDSSIFSETIYLGALIAGTPYALEAKVELPEQVTVEAGQTATVEAQIVLSDNDKAYLDQFPNGIYVEGFLYAQPEGEGVTLNMPILGYYGDWSDPAVFDSEDPNSFSLYPLVAFTNWSQIGTNPYFRDGRAGEEYNAFSYNNPLAEIDMGLLRNAKYIEFTVTDKVTGQEYWALEGSDIAKTYFSANYGQIIPFWVSSMYGEVWDGMDANGRKLPSGTAVTYKVEAWLDDGDMEVDDVWAFDLRVDEMIPKVTNAGDLQSALRIDGDRAYLELTIEEDQHLAAIIFMAPNGTIMGKFEPVDQVPGQTYVKEYDITGFGSEFTVLVADYACNELEVEVTVNLGEQNNAVPEPIELDPNRLYGCETFDGALVEGGWFSVDKDFTDPRNETFDAANRYYSAEFVNGYLIAQNANTGHLELVTPSGTYWSSQVLAENYGSIGDPNVWVLYDMAMDYSTAGDAIYDPWGDSESTDTLFAVGWLYKGDNNNDGKDDGYNALFRVTVSPWNGMVSVEECGKITGTVNGAEILTLGITTEGAMYGISTDGILYSIDPAQVWDDSIGDWGGNAIYVTAVGVTDFVNYPGYGGVNVIQSMGYDHNTGTMYWYAHSQVLVGYAYQNINVTYAVNLETAECTEIGTYGPGGQTCLFVPHDIESDFFTMGVDPTGVSVDKWQMFLVEGQTDRLKLKWNPWNAAPQDVTWSSSDDSIAVVDEYGFVTGVTAGEVTITATTQVWNEWRYDDNWNSLGPGWEEATATCMVTILKSEEAIYGYIMADHGNPQNHLTWGTYADNDLRNVTWLGKQYLPMTDMDGNTVMAEPMWAGGTYYNGYVYSVDEGEWEENGVTYVGSRLFRSKVTQGATPGETVIGEPEFIGGTPNMLISAMAFDYNTGRMYCVENRAVGGLGIMDLDTGKADLLGLYNGDLRGAIYIPSLVVTRDGTIVMSDGIANLYTIDPDTLTTKMIYQGNGDPNSAYYEAMCYDYNTDVIYWNMCDGGRDNPLYMVVLGTDQWSGEQTATVIDLGDVSTKSGTQQTIMFVIPDEEPETNFIPVESIEITDGDRVVGLEGGTLQLGTVTVPARPSLQTKTWTSSDESVVTVDQYGNLTYVGIGKATITVSIANKNPADGGPFTDTIEVEVLEAAGRMEAFLGYDQEGTGYYDFWISFNDYDLRHAEVHESMINILTLRTGIYYSGYFYAYNNAGVMFRIDANDHSDFVTVGTNGLTTLDESGYIADQVTGMAVDYNTGIVYAMTLLGQFGTVDLNTGLFTAIATVNNGVTALACDGDGVLYGAGGSYVYTIDKTTGQATALVELPGATMITGPNYMGEQMWNTQMTYDFGTDRLYINATYDSKNYNESSGMYLVDLSAETATASHLGGISLALRGDTKYGQVFLSLLAAIPEDDEVPVGPVNGIILNKANGQVAVGGTTQLTADVRPFNALDKSLIWTSSDESVATVDANGLVTGVAPGTATITITSVETGVTTTCKITVVNLSGPQSVAYTISAQRDALIAFNPALPAQTAVEVVTMSGGSTIRGMAYGIDCLYYAVDVGTYYIYRFDFVTKQSTLLGSIMPWTGLDGIAYDPASNLLYAVGGFYLFQYDLSTFEAGMTANYTNYIMDEDYCTLAGVTVVDGAVYVLGNNYGTPQLMKFSDIYLNDRTVHLKGFPLNAVAGATEMAYDANSGLIYVTDAGSTIYTFDPDVRYAIGTELVWDNNAYDYVERTVYSTDINMVDILGDGIDLNGLAIDATGKYTVTFEDGLGNVLSVNYMVPGASVVSGYFGTPAREGYTFAGWVDAEGNPVTAETLVEGDTTCYATWTANVYTITLIFFNGEEDMTIDVTYGQPVGTLPVPTRAGYAFKGWFLADGDTEYTAETIYDVAGNQTLYATWEEAAIVKIESANAQAGKTVTMEVVLKDNPGIMGLQLLLDYDHSVLTLLPPVNGQLLKDLDYSERTNRLLWTDDAQTTEDGVLCVLTFQVAEGVEIGDYAVRLILERAVNEEYQEVNVAIESGAVYIRNYGDVNDDGVVDIIDVLMLRKYLANLDPVTGESTEVIGAGADANADGVVDVLDVLLLRQYLVECDPVTGESSVELGPQG